MELHKTPERTKSGFVLLDQNMRLVKPVNEYLDFQALRGRAENTLLAYGKDLKTFFEFLEQRKLQYDQVTANMIRDYVEYLRAPDVNTVYLFVESKRSPATINRMISTLHGFYGYHVSMYGIVNPVITEDINSPNGIFRGILYHTRKSNYTRQSVFKVKESEYRIHLFTTTEMRQMHDVLPTARDKLLFKFLLQSGARISEALSLRIEDIPVPDISSDISVLRHVKSKGRYRRFRQSISNYFAYVSPNACYGYALKGNQFKSHPGFTWSYIPCYHPSILCRCKGSRTGRNVF